MRSRVQHVRRERKAIAVRTAAAAATARDARVCAGNAPAPGARAPAAAAAAAAAAVGLRHGSERGGLRIAMREALKRVHSVLH